MAVSRGKENLDGSGTRRIIRARLRAFVRLRYNSRSVPACSDFSSQRSYEFHHGEPESFFQKARSESESAGPRKVQASGKQASGQACEARTESCCQARQACAEAGREKDGRQGSCQAGNEEGRGEEASRQASRQAGSCQEARSSSSQACAQIDSSGTKQARDKASHQGCRNQEASRSSRQA